MTIEPTYTGPLTTQISGDIALGKGYERLGRKMLGALLNYTGAAERLERGEPGGYFKKSLQMEDGTVLTAITNNGHNVLRIETARPTGTVEYKDEHRTATGGTPHDVFVPEAKGLEPSHEVPLPAYPQREWSDPSEEEKKDSTEYMWVGIRSTNPNVPWYAVHAVMVEPDSGPAWNDERLPLRGVIATYAEWQGALALYAGEDGEYGPMLDFPATYASDVPGAVQQNYDVWHEAGYAQDNFIPGTHCLSATMYIDSETYGQIDEGEFAFSANGLRAFVNSSSSQVAPNPARWDPFDPQAKDQTGAGVRNYGDRQIPDSRQVSPCLWDVCYVCDPDERLQEYPCETRPHVLKAREALERAGMRNQILPGEYLLGIHIFDDPPQLRSTRAGEVIPLYAGETYGHRSETSDYDEYMQPINALSNTQIEIEVRLKRGADAVTMRFSTAIASADDRDYTYIPYGYFDWDECAQEGGPNPLGPNWAPQFLAINPMGGSARWVDPDLAPILGGGTYGYPGDDRRPLDIYFTIYGPSQPEQDEFAEYMAHALFAVMEAASAGIYGQMLMKDPGSEGALRAFLTGVSKSQIWRFDPMTGSLAAVPVISSIDDYPYGAQTDEFGNTYQSPYIEPMYWYYPYKVQSKDACRNSLGICITAVKGTYFFENGQVRYSQDPPPNPACC